MNCRMAVTAALLGALFGCAAPAADKGGEASSAFAFAAAQQAPDAAD